jgi:uncharacterized protein DUF5076
MPAYNALNIPPEAAQDGGDELLRVAISRTTGPAMSLRRGFDDPAMWGHLLADVVKHLAQVYAIETKYNKEQAASRIIEAFAKDMASNAPDPGSTVRARS